MMVENRDWKDILTRAAKTFVQAVIGVLVVLAPAAWQEIIRDPLGDGATLVAFSALSAGVAALVSFAWNALKTPEAAKTTIVTPSS